MNKTDVFAEYLQELTAKRNELTGKRIALEAELAAIEAKIEAANVLKDRASPAKATASNGAVPAEKEGPKKTVLWYVNRHPGCTREELVEKMAPHLKTKSQDPKRLLYITIYQLLTKELIEAKTAGGKESLFVPK